MAKKRNGSGGWLAAVLLAAIAGGGYYLVAQELPRRYDALTTAAAQALDKGDTAAATRLALAATQGRHLPFLPFDNARAEGLLLEALLKDQPVLTPVSERQLPEFKSASYIVPQHVLISDDSTKTMVMHNGTGNAWIYDIYDLASGKLLARMASDPPHDGKWKGVAGFSPDLKTAIIGSSEGVFFLDTLTQRPVLTSFKSADDFVRYTISNDRKRVTGNRADVFRVWDLSGTEPRIRDYKGDEAYVGSFFLSPDGATLVTKDKAGTTQLRDARTYALKLSLPSNGPEEVMFTPDNRFMTTITTGRDWSRSVRVWDAATFQRLGPVTSPFDWINSTSVVQDRVLVLQATDGFSLWDIRTHRVIYTARDIPAGSYEVGWRDQKAYAVSADHVVTTSDLNPLLAMDGKALAARACARWGKDAHLKLTAAEVAHTKARIAVDPCKVRL